MEIYSPIGDLLTISDRTGLTQNLTYSQCTKVTPICPAATPNPDAPFDGLLISVRDSFGRLLKFKYNPAGQIDSVSLLASVSNQATEKNTTHYSYDINGNLKIVAYPDNTPSTTDNPVIIYFYGSEPNESANISPSPNPGVTYTHSLTGLVDENGKRMMTYQYDADGRAINEYSLVTPNLARNIDQYSLKYTADTNGPLTTINDPLDSKRSTHFTTVLGVLKPTGTDQPGGSGCSSASSATTYDANGNVASRTDFNGHKACYAYDLVRNLETKRVEGLASVADCPTVLADGAALPANSRKTSTQWHPDWRLPVRVAGPNRRATSAYNGQVDPATGLTANCGSGGLVGGKPIAVLCQRSEQATYDVAGRNGFAATLGGTARVWRYTYNATGQVLSEDGPRTDAPDTTTYTYYTGTTASYTQGDLATASRTVAVAPNAKALVTTYDSYTASGQPTQITAANGVVTQLDYYPRGWLKAITVKDRNGANAEATSYTYTPTGLLETATLPDGSKLTYSYDNAHRLQLVTDSLGNKVSYTLDNKGNRIKETYWDTSSAAQPDESVSAVGLRRKISRVYDALDRLQTVTGAEQ